MLGPQHGPGSLRELWKEGHRWQETPQGQACRGRHWETLWSGAFGGFKTSIDRNSAAGSSQEGTLLKTEQQFQVKAQLGQGPKDVMWSVRGPASLLGGLYLPTADNLREG